MKDHSEILSQIDENFAFVDLCKYIVKGKCVIKEISIVRKNECVVYHFYLPKIYQFRGRYGNGPKIPRKRNARENPYPTDTISDVINRHLSNVSVIFVMGKLKRKMLLSFNIHSHRIIDLHFEIRSSKRNVVKIKDSCSWCKKSRKTTCCISTALSYALWWRKFITYERQRNAYLRANQPLWNSVNEPERDVTYGDLMFRNEQFLPYENNDSYYSPSFRLFYMSDGSSYNFLRIWQILMQ